MREVQVATRRPRVPRTAGRQLADVAAGAATHGAALRHGHGTGPHARTGASAHPVGGHSAKVIPLDAAPSFHEPAADPDAETTTTPDAGPSAAAEEAPAAAAPAAPTLTPEQRRAEARRALVRRSAPRLRRKAPQRDLPPAAETRAPAVVEPVPARNFTGRSVAFLVVLFVAAVLLAPTLRVFLDQQAELRAVQEDIASARELEQELTSEIARWDDPAYIKQQARERFNLVMPGEQTYMVVGGDETVADPVPAPASPSEVNPDLPWADALWDSVVRAGTD